MQVLKDSTLLKQFLVTTKTYPALISFHKSVKLLIKIMTILLFLLFIFILISMEEYSVAMIKRGDFHTENYIVGTSIDGFSQTQYYALRDLFYSTGGNSILLVTSDNLIYFFPFDYKVRTGIGRTILNNLIGTFLVIIILAKKIGKV